MTEHPLGPVGWSPRAEAGLAEWIATGASPARVIGVARGWCHLATSDGERSLPSPGLAVGDWLALDGDDVLATMPRWSTLARVDPDGSRQVLAANVDLVLITAPGDRLSSNRVERELVVAWDSGATPVVVLTKLDLAAPDALDTLARRLGSVEIVATSALDGRGLDRLRSILVSPVTAVFLGPSGAGKSTLINALLGEDRLAVGEVRDEDQRGRHTTTSRHLVPLPSGGSLIDMPGLRSLGTDADEESVDATFPEIAELAEQCRFSDCSHQVEPDCAVAAAVASGSLDPARLASYLKLRDESAGQRRPGSR